MGYEENCADYALHGDAERDHWAHEENARHDMWDGHRSSCTMGYEDHNCGDMLGEAESDDSDDSDDPQSLRIIRGHFN